MVVMVRVGRRTWALFSGNVDATAVVAWMLRSPSGWAGVTTAVPIGAARTPATKRSGTCKQQAQVSSGNVRRGGACA